MQILQIETRDARSICRNHNPNCIVDIVRIQLAEVSEKHTILRRYFPWVTNADIHTDYAGVAGDSQHIDIER